MFDDTLMAFKTAASEQSDLECGKQESVADYQQYIAGEWKDFIQKLHKT